MIHRVIGPKHPGRRRGPMTSEQRELFRLRYRMTRWAKRYWPEYLSK